MRSTKKSAAASATGPESGQPGAGRSRRARSRGGFTGTLHLITDGRGGPILIGLRDGNVLDTTMFEPALAELSGLLPILDIHDDMQALLGALP